MSEGRPSDLGAPKDYNPIPDAGWRHSRPYGINYKEDFSKPETRDMEVRLDGEHGDLTTSQGNGTATAPKTRAGKRWCSRTQMTR